MKRLSISTISAFFLAGVVAPAAFADSHGTMQTPGQMQTPGMNQTPGQMHTPGMNRTPGQMHTPGQTSMPSTDYNRMGMGQPLSTDLVSPFQLAYMATGGGLHQGGEGYSAYQARHGNAQGSNIVEAAINQGYISSALMEDQGYINSVNQVLRMQASDWRG